MWSLSRALDKGQCGFGTNDKDMPKSLLYLCGHVFPHVNADSKKSLQSHAPVMERLTSTSLSTLKHNETLMMAKHVFQPARRLQEHENHWNAKQG